MKNKYTKIIFGLITIACLFSVTCHNSIMEKWWEIPEEQVQVSSVFHRVEFEANGGLPAPGDQFIAQDGKVSRVQPMTRAQCGFGGWFTEPDFVNEWDFATDTVTEPLKLYAKWVQIDDIIVDFKIYGVPSVMTELSLISGTKVEPPPYSMIVEAGEYYAYPDTLDDYSFDGWYSDDDYIFRWDFATRTVTESITLYARWVQLPPTPDPDPDPDPTPDPIPITTPTYCTVTFVTNDPSLPSVDEQRIVQGGNVIEPPAMSRDGFGFGGWYMDEEFTYRFNFAAPISDSRSLYAKWDTNYYTVTFNANGGSPQPDLQRVAHNAPVTRPGSISNNDMRFGGWYADPAFTREWDFTEDTILGNLTLYARWEAKPIIPVYTVTFDANGGNPAPMAQRIMQGGKATEPTPMRKAAAPGLDIWEGFGGWYSNAGLTDEWNFSVNTVTSDTTLYAKWETTPHCLVTFEANGGNPVPRAQDLIQGTKIVEPFAMSRTGYGFGGWYTEPELLNQWDFNTTVGQTDYTLYAKWVTNYYDVAFDAKGGSPAPANQRAAHGTLLSKPAPMRKSGQGFMGWYTDEAFTNEWDFAKDIVDKEGIVLYAKWGDAHYIVKFDLKLPSSSLEEIGSSGHGLTVPDQELTLGGIITEPYIGDISEWSFYGWFYVDGDEAIFKNDIPGNLDMLEPWDFDRVVTEDDFNVPGSDGRLTLTLYARWVPYVPDMVWVRKGSFTMGAAGTGTSPAHFVKFETGFYMARNLVTQENREDSYYEVMKDVSIYNATAGSPGSSTPSQFKASQPTRPVDRVSWFDAIVYSNVRSQAEGLTPVYSLGGETDPAEWEGPIGWNANASIFPASWNNITADFSANGYRLPTEAEWEYAAKGGNGSPGNFTYAGSNTIEDVAWFNTNSGSQTHPVGTKMPNALGIYDMSGNVMEWCWDWYDSKYYSAPNNHIDPKGPMASSANPPERVRRGGSWNNAINNMRTIARASFVPNNNTWVMGIRVVRNVGPTEIY